MLRRNQGPLRRKRRRKRHCASSSRPCHTAAPGVEMSYNHETCLHEDLLMLQLLPYCHASRQPGGRHFKPAPNRKRAVIHVTAHDRLCVIWLCTSKASHLEALQELLLFLHKQMTVLLHNDVCHEQEVGAQASPCVGALALQAGRLPVCCYLYQCFQGLLDLLLGA